MKRAKISGHLGISAYHSQNAIIHALHFKITLGLWNFSPKDRQPYQPPVYLVTTVPRTRLKNDSGMVLREIPS